VLRRELMAKEKVWAGFKGKLPQWDGTSKPEYQEQIVQRQKELLEEFVKTNEFMDFLEKNKLRKDELKAELKELEINIEASQRILVDRFENDGTQSIRSSSGTLFYLKDDPYSSVEDSNALKKWFKDNGMEEMFTVPWQSLNALVKDRLKSGKPEPNGVKVYIKTSVETRKG
jgi:hypothetical protein